MPSVTLYEHPEYVANYDSWLMYKDLFEGDHTTLSGPVYLWKHVLEDNDTITAAKIRSLRQLRTRYLNTIEPCISRYTSIFFREKLIIPGETSELLGENVDITGQSDGLDSFFSSKVLLNYLLYGRVFVVADNYNIQPQNAAQETNLTPTLECLSPLDVPDWEIETEDPQRKGKLKFIRCEYKIVEPRSDSTQQPTESLYSKEYRFQNGVYSVRLWREEQKKQADVKTDSRQWVLVEEKEFPGFKDLPVSYLFGESWIKDVAQETLRLYNFMSSRDNILYHQAYQRTFFIGNLNAQQEKAVAEYTAAVLPEGTVVDTIEPVNPVALDLAIERSVNAVFRIAFNQHRTIAADSKAVESSDSQQEGKEQLVSLVLSEIDKFERLINESVSDWFFFKDKKLNNFDPKIKIDRDIQEADIEKQIQIYATLRDEITSIPEWRKQTLSRFAQFQDLQEVEKVMQQILALPEVPQPVQSGRQLILSRLNGNQARNTSDTESANQPQGS